MPTASARIAPGPRLPVAKEKRRSPGHDVRHGGQLVRRDRGPAEIRDKKVFDRRVHHRRQIQRALLRGIEQDALSVLLLPGTLSGEPVGSQRPPQRGEVPVARSDIDRRDLSCSNLVLQRFLQGSGRRWRRLRLEQSRSAQSTADRLRLGSDQRLQARRRRGIDQGGGGILLIQQLQKPGIEDPVPGDNQNPAGVRPVCICWRAAGRYRAQPRRDLATAGRGAAQSGPASRRELSLSLGQAAATAAAAARARKYRRSRPACPGSRRG